MASHFKWYPDGDNVVVPWNAQYEFPSQANKAMKMTPRIPPKNGSLFGPGQVIRLEFPAQGYMNTQNTTLEFDVNLQGYGTTNGDIVRFQNNIQSIFSRARLLYGSTPLEDIINYNVIIRMLTECTGTSQASHADQNGVANGIGGVEMSFATGTSSTAGNGLYSIDWSTGGPVHVRQRFIQGVDASIRQAALSTINTDHYDYGISNGMGSVPNQKQSGQAEPAIATYLSPPVALGAGAVPQATKAFCTRRYQISLGFGLFNQDKLIPLKFMASQLAVELSLASADECIFVQRSAGTGSLPTYSVANVNIIPEILEFDASYDAMFLKGLREGGVPILFSSWHTYIFSTGGASTLNLAIQERSRSVKALFAVQRRAPTSIFTDSHALIFDSTSALNTADGSSLQTYQYRIGGRYFPASPVQLSTMIGGRTPNGGAEAYVELEKSLNIMGDYRLSTGVSPARWATPVGTNNIDYGLASRLNEFDYNCAIINYTGGGLPSYKAVTTPSITIGNSCAGGLGSSVYVSSTNLETSNGVEISGMNAEEQADISFLCTWSDAQSSSFVVEVYAYFDSMIVLRENNVLQLIQ
jgi:hypothetical protein